MLAVYEAGQSVHADPGPLPKHAQRAITFSLLSSFLSLHQVTPYLPEVQLLPNI